MIQLFRKQQNLVWDPKLHVQDRVTKCFVPWAIKTWLFPSYFYGRVLSAETASLISKWYVTARLE